jgi:hypothetical protein
MKARFPSEAPFFAKMVLLFSLVILGQPQQRKALESYVEGFFRKDSTVLGQIPSSKIGSSQNIPSSLSH